MTSLSSSQFSRVISIFLPAIEFVHLYFTRVKKLKTTLSLNNIDSLLVCAFFIVVWRHSAGQRHSRCFRPLTCCYDSRAWWWRHRKPHLRNNQFSNLYHFVPILSCLRPIFNQCVTWTEEFWSNWREEKIGWCILTATLKTSKPCSFAEGRKKCTKTYKRKFVIYVCIYIYPNVLLSWTSSGNKWL